VVGLSRSFDDAMFQDWNVRTFDPSVRFRYREFEHEGKRVGWFEVEPAGASSPHVTSKDLSTELREGQVWFRVGSRNTLARSADLKRLFSPTDTAATRLKGIHGKLGRFWNEHADEAVNRGQSIPPGPYLRLVRRSPLSPVMGFVSSYGNWDERTGRLVPDFHHGDQVIVHKRRGDPGEAVALIDVLDVEQLRLARLTALPTVANNQRRW
jgi:hypothetical protein